MSRHRNIRSLDADEEYDDYHSCYGHSVEDDFCISPRTEAQFLYNRNVQNPSMTAYLPSSETVPEEDFSGDDSFDSFKNDSRISSFNDLDTAKLQSCIEELQNIVGDTIPESVLRSAAIDYNFDVEKTLNFILEDKAPKPRRERKVVAPLLPHVPANTNIKPNICLEKVAASSIKPEGRREKETTEATRTASPARQSNKASNSAAKALNVDESSCATPKSMSSTKEKASTPQVTSEVLKISSDKEDVELKSSTRPTRSDKSGKEIYDKERGDEKPLINLVVIGHVDAGKSTLMGHLLYSLGSVSQRNMHKFEKDSKKLGKGSFMYAWVLDETPEERNRGITMDVAFSSFETPHRAVTLLDAPGHKDFIPNMITGAAQADVAILVIDSTTGEFETGFEAGGQTREHTMLIRSLGVTEMAIAVNKMDNVGWSEERFKDIKTRMTTFLKQVGFKESDVTFVPCSGLTGENLVNGPQEGSFKLWYSGPSLVEVIDQFHPPERPVDRPFRMCVSDTFKGVTGGFCVSGKIEAGFVKSGDKIQVMPAGEQAVVKGISFEEKALTYGFAGDHVVLNLSGVEANNVASGSMLCSVERPVKVTTRFEARLVIFNLSVPITKGFPVILHYQSLSEQATVKKLISILNRNSGDVVKSKPRCLTKNSSAVVEIEISRPICIELFKDFKDLGRFMLRSGGCTIAAGLVTEIK